MQLLKQKHTNDDENNKLHASRFTRSSSMGTATKRTYELQVSLFSVSECVRE